MSVVHAPGISCHVGIRRGEFLAAAIDSILAQTFTDFELIVIDDGSRDRSPQIIREYLKRDGRIRLIQLERNLGPGPARQRGLDAAQGVFVTGMDSDDVCSPERLQKQVDFLHSNPDCGAVGTHANVVNVEMQHLYDRKPPQQHALIMFEQFIGGDPFVHASVMTRRELLLDAGGYDLSLQWGTDSDLLTRLMGRTRFGNIAEPLYTYRRRAGQRTAQRSDSRVRDMQLIRARRFERLWGEAPKEVMDRVAKVRPWSKLSWGERRAAKRDLIRLIDSMIAAKWVEPADRPLLVAAMNRRLEQVSPRLWQMFCHWRRHRFGRPA